MPRAPAVPSGHRLRVAAVIEWAKGLVVAALALATAGWLDARAESEVLREVGRTAWLGGAAAREALGEALHGFDRYREWAGGAAFVYVVVRLLEGLGLWRGREWARWLGIAGCVAYLPFEAMAVLEHPGPAPLVALVVTTGLVALLWPPRRPENGWP